MLDLYKPEEYSKAKNYDLEKNKLAIITSTFSLILVLVLLFTGFLGTLDDWTGKVTSNGITQTLLFFGILALASDLLNLPFSLYATFVIEEKYGFNKMTMPLFFADKFKTYLITAIFGGLLISLFVIFYTWAGHLFWLYMWIAISALTLLIATFFTSWILPLFNKLTPLPHGDLRNAIEQYCQKVNFPLADLFIMDGSKRSTKSNAFFSGIGGKKKIVLFDTLISNHTTPEIVAVLAHEIGHFKKKHVFINTIVSIAVTGVSLYILGLLITNPQLSFALGGSGQSLRLGLIAFAFIYSPVSTLTGIGVNYLSRTFEFQADHFAATTFQPAPLAEALKKLSVHNLSNLNPHPLYVFFHYTHPPLFQRLLAILKI